MGPEEISGGEEEPIEIRVFNGVRDVAAEVLNLSDPNIVVLEARFKEDLNADSLDLVEIVMGLEDRFKVEQISEEKLKDVLTVKQTVDLILTILGDDDGSGGDREPNIQTPPAGLGAIALEAPTE